MRVYLSHLGRRIDSAYYRELLAEPPVEYILDAEDADLVITKHKFSTVEYLGKKFIEFAKVPPIKIVKRECDVIHAAHHLVISKKPWIVDFEHVISIAGMNSKVAGSILSRKIMSKLLTSKNCKKILPWTHASKQSLLSLLGRKFEERVKQKIEVLYPAIRPPSVKKVESDTVRLLHVSRFFYRKGGLEALLAFDELTRRYDVKATIISNVPAELKNRYADNKNLDIRSPVPYEELYTYYYPRTDIFVYPSYGDTFGFPLLEALSFGIPVVTLEDFASAEIIQNGKTGFIIEGYKIKWYTKNKLHNQKYNTMEKIEQEVLKRREERKRIVRDIIEKTSLLIEDSALRKRMSRRAREEVERGKFSIKTRNRKLKEIYESSLE